MRERIKKEKAIKGIALLVSLVFAVVLGIGAVAVTKLHSTEINLVRRQNNSTRAFYLAEAGIQKALCVISNHPDWTNTDLTTEANRDKHGLDFTVEAITGDASTKTITCSGMGVRQIQAQAQSDNWLDNIPAAVYSKGVVKIHFEKLRKDGTSRDTRAFIDGGSMPGIYSTDSVTSKREGEGRILGTPPVLENQNVPEGLQDGMWDTFDIDTLRGIAKTNGTYFSADETDDDYNNPYNKRGEYTLPVELDDETKITEGVFFFDTRNGEPLDDELEPRNRIKVKLEGTTELVKGVIVVVGDLHIKDTDNYDFLFDGVILVLNDLKIDDKKNHRRGGTNDSDIFIKGAVLSDNIIKKGEKRKKEKPAVDIKDATIEYDASAITKASSPCWAVIPGTWQEMDISN